MDHTSSYEADTIVGSEAGACPTKSAMLKEYGDRPIKTVVSLSVRSYFQSGIYMITMSDLHQDD